MSEFINLFVRIRLLVAIFLKIYAKVRINTVRAMAQRKNQK